ncbi:MAG: hypothetical protein US49_C0002G0012 [candidate division TM6 bacterium GW2011_GWF2_37_49]|nr:MAG: hypothetical protein US49_C0002G0012 [candidate division TM6 bacterium GW2011_GWF2_37_49]
MLFITENKNIPFLTALVYHWYNYKRLDQNVNFILKLKAQTQ